MAFPRGFNLKRSIRHVWREVRRNCSGGRNLCHSASQKRQLLHQDASSKMSLAKKAFLAVVSRLGCFASVILLIHTLYLYQIFEIFGVIQPDGVKISWKKYGPTATVRFVEKHSAEIANQKLVIILLMALSLFSKVGIRVLLQALTLLDKDMLLTYSVYVPNLSHAAANVESISNAFGTFGAIQTGGVKINWRRDANKNWIANASVGFLDDNVAQYALKRGRVNVDGNMVNVSFNRIKDMTIPKASNYSPHGSLTLQQGGYSSTPSGSGTTGQGSQGRQLIPHGGSSRPSIAKALRAEASNYSPHGSPTLQQGGYVVDSYSVYVPNLPHAAANVESISNAFGTFGAI
ncbi:hypothetical protein POM88_043340 [Heracleum sosnowskyi]|uniref:Uncharacterized protein n=1 Tax=Heracleum sosnowskyi TaxID=360622 RepID=A0AAD8H1V7_9APIA|nr:hypothetical protein POM88_043340 [Heracleum sosnowskyi]